MATTAITPLGAKVATAMATIGGATIGGFLVAPAAQATTTEACESSAPNCAE